MRNRFLKIEYWPDRDRRAFERAITKGSILDDESLAANWRPATQDTNRGHYGRWLWFLASTGRLQENASPGSRCTPDALNAYVQKLSSTTKPVSVCSSVVALKSVLTAIAPECDWSWMTPIIRKLHAQVKPSQRPGQMLDARMIFHKALGLMRKLRRDGLAARNERASYRNGLMLALLVSSPLRRKNLAALSIGTTLRQSGDDWCIYFRGADVKNGRPIDYQVAPKLIPFLEFYLRDVRPGLLGQNASDELWINAYGSPMKGHALWLRLTEFTEKHFGVHISPHDLRSVTATMLAHESEGHAFAAAALLGHHDPSVTEKHYLRARNIKASRRANEVLEAVRKRSLSAAGRCRF